MYLILKENTGSSFEAVTLTPDWWFYSAFMITGTGGYA